jgi:hypothetical protein
MLDDETRRGGRRQRLGKDRGTARLLVCPEAQFDRMEILEAEAPAEDGGVGEVLLRLVGQPGGAALDQRAHGGREQALGVSRERPRPVDLLDHPHLAVAPGELLDDEGDALRLSVHGRRAREIDLPAEDLLNEFGRLQLREPFELEAAHHSHPLHVRDERYGLVDHSELVPARREPEEDRQIRVRANDVAEHPHAVLVSPLEVVDEHSQGSCSGQRPDGDGGEIEYAQELLIRREALQRWVVPTRDCVEHPLQLLLCAVPLLLGRS